METPAPETAPGRRRRRFHRWQARRGGRPPRHRPRASVPGRRAIRAFPSRRTGAASRRDFVLAGGCRDLLLAGALFVALRLGGLAQLLEANDLTGGSPVPIGNLVDQRPDPDTGVGAPAGRLEHDLGDVLHQASLAALAECPA